MRDVAVVQPMKLTFQTAMDHQSVQDALQIVPATSVTYNWQGNTLYSTDKLQSAWCRWNFDQAGVTTKIYSTFFIGQQMYMVIGRSFGGTTQVYLETLIADAQPTSTTVPPGGVWRSAARMTRR